MLNPRHLETLLAIQQHGSFSAAGAAIGRSHSAVSLHIKALEEELGAQLVDRSQRPPALTPDGAALAEQARRMARVLEDIRAIGRGDLLWGRLRVGVVPTAMTHLAPPALARLRHSQPDVRIDIHTGLSDELAEGVRSADLDAALLTNPDLPPDGLNIRPVANEPLIVIAPPGTKASDDATALRSQPFIWFSRKTWAGQQIERRLLDRGIRVQGSMEVDSLEAIEALVRHGLGCAIVPDRGAAPDLVQLPFGNPQASRQVVLINRQSDPKARLIDAWYAALVSDAGPKGARPLYASGSEGTGPDEGSET